MGDTQSTFIANAYTGEIHARVTVNKALYTRALHEGGTSLKAGAAGQGIGVRVHAKTEVEIENLQQIPGFVSIPPGDYLGFPMIGMDGQVFVSISAGDKNIAENYPVMNGRSIIIDEKGYIRNAKPRKIWIDERGGNHHVCEKRKVSVIAADDTKIMTADKKKMEQRAIKAAPPLIVKKEKQKKTKKKQKRVEKSGKEKEEEEKEREIFISSIRDFLSKTETNK